MPSTLPPPESLSFHNQIISVNARRMKRPTWQFSGVSRRKQEFDIYLRFLWRVGGSRTLETLRRIWVPHPSVSRVRVLTFLFPRISLLYLYLQHPISQGVHPDHSLLRVDSVPSYSMANPLDGFSGVNRWKLEFQMYSRFFCGEQRSPPGWLQALAAGSVC